MTKSSDKIKVKRSPKRGIYDRDSIYKMLDREFLCHVSFVHNGHPVCIPTMYGRKDDALFIHGATVSRMITELEKGIDVCVSVARVDGLVLARSAFHHSLNYESVVVFGKATLVSDDGKTEALKIISDHAIPGRWEEVRLPSDKELKGTKVLRISIDDVSGKARTGDPVDDQADYSLPIWAGVLPIDTHYAEPIPDPQLDHSLNTPVSVQKLLEARLL